MRMRTEKETERAMVASARRGLQGLIDTGSVDKAVMRRFDEAVVGPTPTLEPAEIKALREKTGTSQAVMALHLGVAVGTLGQWERGLRKPDGPALRLLALIQKHGLEYVR